MTAIQEVQVQTWTHQDPAITQRALAVEEPLEIQLLTATGLVPVSLTMRTPGQDGELAQGFLFTEGIISHTSAIQQVFSPAENKIVVVLAEGQTVAMNQLDRNFYTTSSCGVCGKASADALAATCPFVPSAQPFRTGNQPNLVLSLPDRLRAVQEVFNQTGGLHAAALFDPSGNLLAHREDVGRHNALDKLIGHFFQKEELPLRGNILLLSGRISFELVQKAAMAGIESICAIGAPSSLALLTAQQFGIELIGFLRKDSYNVYC